jgi:hypothetical protein
MGKIISNREKYIRLFTIYEKGLKKYHQVFRDPNYSLEFIVKKKQFSFDYDFQVIISITKNPLWRLYLKNPREIKEILMDYSSFFSITEIRVLQPLQKVRNYLEEPITSKPIEERIFYEIFSEISNLDFELH